MIARQNDSVTPPEGIDEILDNVCRACCRAEGIDEIAFSVSFVTDDEIRELNNRARGIDKSTDVLSFPSIQFPSGRTAKDCPKRVKREYDMEFDMPYLGDCVISLEHARAQAAEYGHSVEREIAYLAAHSAFHLMGYDHMTDDDKRKMRAMEKKAMDDVRLWRADEMTDEMLFKLACEALENAYAPYSKFRVGACILTDDGRTFNGCNFENASYGGTICAERCATGAAVVAGARKFIKIAIAGEHAMAWPCGLCRQVLNEFSEDMTVICGCKDTGETEAVKLTELLPKSFGPKDLL